MKTPEELITELVAYREANPDDNEIADFCANAIAEIRASLAQSEGTITVLSDHFPPLPPCAVNVFIGPRNDGG